MMLNCFRISAIALVLTLGVVLGGLSSAVKAQDFSEIIKVADRSVGRVLNFKNDRFRGHGSGFIFGLQGERPLFLTNHHVIEGGDEFLVGFLVDGQPRVYGARVISQSTVVDLAVLALISGDEPFHRHRPLAIATGKQEKGKAVAAIGYPGLSDDIVTDGFDNPAFFETTLTTGNISRVATGTFLGGGEFEIVQHTAAVNPGNSGGPLIDQCGTVVGVNTLVPTLREGDRAVPQGTFWSSSNRTIASFLDEKAGVPFDRSPSTCGASEQAPVAPNTTVDNSVSPDPGPGQRRLFMVLALILVALIFAGAFGYVATRNSTGTGRSPLASTPASRSLALSLHIAGASGSFSSAALRRGVTIGRDSKSDVTVESRELSRRHARLSLRDRKLMIEDLSSSNGTTVDGKKIRSGEPVQINMTSKVTLAEIPLDLKKP